MPRPMLEYDPKKALKVLFDICKKEEVEEKDINVVRKIIPYIKDINAVLESDDDEFNGSTPLLIACENAHEELIKILVQAGANVNVKSKDGEYPLHIVCGHSLEEIVPILLAAGARVDVKNAVGDTPLLYAYDVPIIRTLLKHGADPNAQDAEGNTLLHKTKLTNDAKFSKIRKELLNYSVNEKILNKDGRVASDAARIEPTKALALLFDICKKEQVDVLDVYNTGNYISYIPKDLLNSKQEGQTPLLIACRKGHEKIIKLLVNAGANVKIADQNGVTPLHVVCRLGLDNLVQLIVEAGANVNAKDRNGRVPLQHAGKTSIMKQLLEYGASPNSQDINGNTMLHYLYLYPGNEHQEAKTLLLRYLADPTILNNNGRVPKDALLPPTLVTEPTDCPNEKCSICLAKLTDSPDENPKNRKGCVIVHPKHSTIHIFHKYCITKYYMGGGKTCPLCRVNLFGKTKKSFKKSFKKAKKSKV